MQRAVIVLGMHRSGTSCLAGILENAGVDFGEVSTQNPFNPKGNRENRRIMDLHESLLRHNNGSWDDPPAAIEWPKHLREERDKIIHDFHTSPFWGFKDPRTLLTLDGWLEALPNAVFAGTFRHPLSVARSLQERNRFSVEKSLHLWKTYNDKLLFYSDLYKFPIISFDLQAEDYMAKVALIPGRLGLQPEPGAPGFFEDTIRHPLQAAGDLPGDVTQLYDELARKAI